MDCDRSERELGTKDGLLQLRERLLCQAVGYRWIDATEASLRRDEIDVRRSPNMIIQQQREVQRSALMAMVKEEEKVVVVGGAKGNGQWRYM